MRIWMVENTDPEREKNVYRPNRWQKKTTKFYSVVEATKLYDELKPNGSKLYFAEVGEWQEIEVE